MAQCTRCGEYTKFNGGLCIKCYHDKNSVDKAVTVDESNGLTEKQHDYRYGMIKGRIAETLIQ